MQLSCDSCNRTFDVDSRRVQDFVAAKCVCGAKLPFQEEITAERAGPQRLGKYVLLQRIAVGGMGEIFYGKIGGIEGFEREVAIKKMLPHLSEDRAFIDQMVKEAKLTVQLNHPNIVQVYDLAKEGSEYYIAMEYVPGVTVGQLLERCSRSGMLLPFEVAVHITMQTLQGLAYAHDLRGADGEPMQILHRDITPQNIMVTRNAWVKITDFGIAKARNEISTTSPGMIKGKLGYIAPEQLTGGDEADQRIDLFCAAIVLWESLAARRLFKGVDEIDTFRMISECAIPPLSQHRDDVPPEIENALRGGLARMPDNRYKHADEFFGALNTSIFPNTADEYAAIAKRYFAEHPEFFEGLERLGQLEITDDFTVEMSTSTDDGAMIDILEVTSTHRVPGARVPIAGAVLGFAAVLAILAILAVALRDDIKAWLNPLEPLTLQEVTLAVGGERTRVLACYQAADDAFRALPSLSARLTIPSTGSVAAADLMPAAAELGAVGACVADVLQSLKFRPHRDAVFTAEVDLPEPALAPEQVSKAKRTRGKKSGTKKVAKPLTEQAIKSQITAAVQRVSGSVAACGDAFAELPNPPKKFTVTVAAAASGSVQAVDIDPNPGSDAAKQCLVRAVRKMKLPERAAGYKFSFELSLK